MVDHPAPLSIEIDGLPVRVTHPDRLMFPDVGLTKRDLIAYYLSVGPGILRALRQRPTTLERWPDGVHDGVKLSQRGARGGDAFFQKRVPAGAPAYVRTCRISFPSGRHADEVCPDSVAVVA